MIFRAAPLLSMLLLPSCDTTDELPQDPKPAGPLTKKASHSSAVVPEVALAELAPESDELRRAVEAWVPNVRACYATAVRDDPSAAGAVFVSVRDAGEATVTVDSLPASVRDCVQTAAGSWDFGAFGATGDIKAEFSARARQH